MYFFCLHWVFVALHRLSLVSASRTPLQWRCAGFSSRPFSGCGARALGTWASVAVVFRLSSCGIQALVAPRGSLCGDLPGPGIEPGSPALAGRFSSTVLPGKVWGETLMLVFL